MIVGPVLVTVLAPRTATRSAPPSGTGIASKATAADASRIVWTAGAVSRPSNCIAPIERGLKNNRGEKK
jgi:hypothetical protein